MRRLVLVFMLCLLPLQWSWAAVATICAHEAGKSSHLGHHEHQHQGAGVSETDTGEDANSLAAAGNHPDCGTCHGVGTAFLGDAGEATMPAATADRWPDFAAHIPDPPLESFLRPPLNFVA